MSGTRAGGFALISVLLVLSILLSLSLPFVLSMEHGASATQTMADEKHVSMLSESVRDAILFTASKSHRAIDEDPHVDTIREFPDRYEIPEAFKEIESDGFDKHLLSAEVRDPQARFNLNTASPLVVANLLDLCAKLRRDHEPDETELELDDASGFPDAGYVVVRRELIRYRAKDGNRLIDCDRGQHAGSQGFASAVDHTLAEDSMVIDVRALLVACHSFYFADGQSRNQYRPWASVAELARIAKTGWGGFTPTDLAVLRSSMTTASISENAAEWGKPERVFEDVEPGSVTLRVRSAAFIGAGSVVRIRSLDGERSEYGLVWESGFMRTQPGMINLPKSWFINLLLPVAQSFKGIDTVVEPLIPQPVNVNTAPPAVLTALIHNVRATRSVNPQKVKGGLSSYSFSRREAQSLAGEILALRGDDQPEWTDDGPRPFKSVEDFVRRFLGPHLQSTDLVDKYRFMLLFHALTSGRAGEIRMATAPICFASAPIVEYRAAAARLRASGRLAAREERSGVAAVMPNATLDLIVATQQGFETAFRLDRHAPWYLTMPINTGAISPLDMGTNPSSRSSAQILPFTFPDVGIGQPRFPSQDSEGSGFRPQPSTTPFAFRRGQAYAHESLWTSLDPDGRNLGQEGPYEMHNNGPRGRGSKKGGQTKRKRGSAAFPFTENDGLVGRNAISFWFKLDGAGEQALFDLSVDDEMRNRISLAIREGELVLEVLDEAGIDPDAGQINKVRTSPERTAGTWKVPLTEFDLQPDIWFHASLSVEGNQPDQMALLIDNVPRGDPEFRTYLSSPLPEYARDKTVTWALDDKNKFLTIPVEDTEGFPDRGVLKIGLELFEYSSKDGASFHCKFDDSMGGRIARMSLREFRPAIPVDNMGRPTVNIDQLKGGMDLDIAPPHPIGAAVELYGYALPVYRDQIIQPDNATLSGSIGPFAVARIINSDAQPIAVPLPRGGAFPLGRGLLNDDPVDIELGDPLPSEKYPPEEATDPIASAFSESGGYALLMQEMIHFQSGQLGGGEVHIGGIELIRYGGRSGNKLSSVQRGLTFPHLKQSGGGQPGRRNFDGTSRKFVTEWSSSVLVNAGKGKGIEVKKLPQYLAYLVPISLPISGNPVDPETIGRVEWLQLLSEGGDEADTEWVRYDMVEDGFIIRARLQSWQRVLGQLTRNLSQRALSGLVQQLGGNINNPDLVTENVYPPVQQRGMGYIGYIDQVEVDFPQIHAARGALGFRGDPFTGTTSHAHESNTMAMQCHRMELDWGNYGATTGRAGRNDRIALVGGSQSEGSSQAPVEWHTVNWVRRRFGHDNVNNSRSNNGGPGGAELLGRWPFQLVAFKEYVQRNFLGPQERDHFRDSRLIDRMIKFPSGERPAAGPDQCLFGSSVQRDVPPATGLIDELHAFRHLADVVLVDESFDDQSEEFLIRERLLMNTLGARGVSHNVTRMFPEHGGLILVDGEIMAYETRQADGFKIARNGRGLLGTEPRGHDEGARVYFLTQIPAAILSHQVNETSSQLLVKGLGSLPRHGGTILMNGELLHYTWTLGDVMLEMPRWFDPEREDIQGRGLFRGRYGSAPATAGAGEVIIFQPFRYWDRDHERADDPEMAHFQITWSQTPVWYSGIYWEEEEEDSLVDVQCLLRVDGQGSFADDPEKNPNLFLFPEGSIEDLPVPIQRQGSRVEARFRSVYKPGCFDPQEYLAHGWKKAATVNAVLITLEGEGRILVERVSAR